MTVLVGDKLSEYLCYLESQFDNLAKNSDNEFCQLAHSSMKDIIYAEKTFLEKYHSFNGNEPSLSFNGNGLPYLESLSADVEKMSELTDEPEFNRIAETYDKEFTETIEKNLYFEATPLHFAQKLKKLKRKTITKSRIKLSKELKNGMLELIIQQDNYIEGIDKDSRETPVLSRLGKARYQVSFNQVVYDFNEKLFSLNENALVPVNNKSLEKRAGNELVDTNALYSMVKKTGKGLKNLTRLVLASTLAVPTTIRTLNDLDVDDAMKFFPLFGGILNGVNLIPMIIHLAKDGSYPLALIIPAVTNAISGLYEWYRYETYKNNPNKALGKENKKLLETGREK